MNMNKRTLLDHWLWEGPMRKTFVLAASGIPVLLAIVLYLLYGPKTLFVLCFAAFGPLFALIYGVIGKRISKLTKEIPPDQGEIITALILQGLFQAPGVIVLSPNTLILQPVFGKRTEVSRDRLSSWREVVMFNGELLIGKTGFWFSQRGQERLACAVPNSFADDFRFWLSTPEKTGD